MEEYGYLSRCAGALRECLPDLGGTEINIQRRYSGNSNSDSELRQLLRPAQSLRRQFSKARFVFGGKAAKVQKVPAGSFAGYACANPGS